MWTTLLIAEWYSLSSETTSVAVMDSAMVVNPSMSEKKIVARSSAPPRLGGLSELTNCSTSSGLTYRLNALRSTLRLRPTSVYFTTAETPTVTKTAADGMTIGNQIR